MRRREFVTLLGSAASAWPFVARAQQPTKPVIGFLDPRSPDAMTDRLRGFRQGLKETGYFEEENVTTVFRWAENHVDRLSALAADLVGRKVALIVASGGPGVAFAAKTATTTIPILFLVAEDPVRLGLVASLARPDGNLTGPIDAIVLLRMLILQSLYNLSDEQVEYQVRDRLSFTRFLSCGIEDCIPDGTTLWLFREKLAQAGVIEKLFDRFDRHLGANGYVARGGQIVDATIVAVPRQRNTREENETVKSGRTPAAWEKKPAKNRQKDKDARWTKKHGRSFYGYKNHVNADAKHKLIRRYDVSDAAVQSISLIATWFLSKSRFCVNWYLAPRALQYSSIRPTR